MTIIDVMEASAAPQHDMAINKWCRSVWITSSDNCQTIIDLLAEHQIT